MGLGDWLSLGHCSSTFDEGPVPRKHMTPHWELLTHGVCRGDATKLGSCFWMEEAVAESEAPGLSGGQSSLRSREDWSLWGEAAPGACGGLCQPVGPASLSPGLTAGHTSKFREWALPSVIKANPFLINQ